MICNDASKHMQEMTLVPSRHRMLRSKCIGLEITTAKMVRTKYIGNNLFLISDIILLKAIKFKISSSQSIIEMVVVM